MTDSPTVQINLKWVIIGKENICRKNQPSIFSCSWFSHTELLTDISSYRAVSPIKVEKE